jgi:alpha-glucosidase
VDALRWLPAPDDVLAFGRGDTFACIVNFGQDPYPLPLGAEVLIASDTLQGGAVPPHTTVWLELAEKAPTGQGKEQG